MTQVEHRKKILDALKQEVMSLLNWSETKYCNYQYEQGLIYLHAYVGEDGAHKLERSRIFWNWWKNQWAIRDEDYTIGLKPISDIPLREEVYLELHDGKILVSAMHPHRFIMEQSYTQMVDELIQHELSESASKEPINARNDT